MIESLSNSKVKYAASLKQKKYRNMYNQFLVEGEHLVIEAIKSKRVDYIFSTEADTFMGIETLLVTNSVFSKLSELGNDFGLIAVCNKSDEVNLSNKILILDGIQDPGNMGTLIRSAAAFGFKTIISENSVDYYNEKVIRGSQGAVFYISLLEKNLIDFIENNNDYSFYGTNVEKGDNLNQINFNDLKIAIILGNEGNGVRPEIQSLATKNIKISMLETESLNVGVAGSIIMYTVFDGGK